MLWIPRLPLSSDFTSSPFWYFPHPNRSWLLSVLILNRSRHLIIFSFCSSYILSCFHSAQLRHKNCCLQAFSLSIVDINFIVLRIGFAKSSYFAFKVVNFPCHCLFLLWSIGGIIFMPLVVVLFIVAIAHWCLTGRIDMCNPEYMFVWFVVDFAFCCLTGCIVWHFSFCNFSELFLAKL